ncbi:MAG: ribonuclease III [Synergistaceae bacterium]|nr:ribonuclease III [Synergistaceae bacterium]
MRFLQEKLGYFFRDRELLYTALCHASYANEQGFAKSNERLEFLGDSVLGMITAHVLYESYPDATEGELSAFRVDVVCRDALVGWASALNLADVLLRGKSLKGDMPPSLLSDAMEAILGAVYLDGGFEAAFLVVRRYLTVLHGDSVAPGSQDAKSGLQTFLQAQDLGLPKYEVVSVKGPSHSPRFSVRVSAAGRSWSAEGKSRKSAELEGAALALAELCPEKLRMKDEKEEKDEKGGEDLCEP